MLFVSPGSRTTAAAVLAAVASVPAAAQEWNYEAKTVRSVDLLDAASSGGSVVAALGTGAQLDILSDLGSWIQVRAANGKVGYLRDSATYVVRDQAGAPADTAANARMLPPATTFDPTFGPLSRDADGDTKLKAVLDTARGQLGTPWAQGTNKDRGDSTFDCSNFTNYVFRHALGHRFSTSSQSQALYIGWPVAQSRRRPGDLIVFNWGSHVGIYVGWDTVIQCGGGKGGVDYLSVAPNTWWGQHITAVKRVYVGSASPTVKNEPVATAPRVLEVASATLNVRSLPGTIYPIVAQITQGQRYVQVATSGFWRLIAYDGNRYWISGYYASTVTGARAIQVTANTYVRTGPGTSYANVGLVRTGQYYAVSTTKGDWRKIWFAGSGERWVGSYGTLLVTP